VETTIKLGISTCLLGEKVRYDGQHKLDRFITQTLGQFVEFVPVCPEVECGLPTPREAMRLVGDPQSPRLVTTRTGVDHTDRMHQWGALRVKELVAEELCGYIFKSKSPSSGMARVKVYNDKGMPAQVGVGVWARMFMDHFPELPVEEEGRLHDPKLREMFIERIFVMRRWRSLLANQRTLAGLVDFHSRHKFLIVAHSPELARELGKIVAAAKDRRLDEVLASYLETLTRALSWPTTLKKNVNVLQHLLGFFKRQLSPDEKQEMLDLIETYGRGYVPLIVPVTLCNHYTRKYDQPYLRDQHYLNPHPLELRLRNHA
jgi:uncharacterized protein YbgA (DUF1722 family)/uncharacterized protein YbbK (DUF523 family)